MAFSISSVSPDTVSNDGGHELVVTGVFEAGSRYRVHMGDLGTTGDPACQSGIAGQGSIVYPKAATPGGTLDTLTVYTPKVADDTTPYNIVVIDYDTSEAHLLSGVITAVKKQFFTSTYSMKHMQPPNYKTGPRTIDQEEPT